MHEAGEKDSELSAKVLNEVREKVVIAQHLKRSRGSPEFHLSWGF